MDGEIVGVYMKKILIGLILGLVLVGCSNKSTHEVNPLAVKALAGSDDYTLEMMLGER